MEGRDGKERGWRRVSCSSAPSGHYFLLHLAYSIYFAQPLPPISHVRVAQRTRRLTTDQEIVSSNLTVDIFCM